MIYIMEDDLLIMTKEILCYSIDNKHNDDSDVYREEMYIVTDYSDETNYNKYGEHDKDSDDFLITNEFKLNYKFYFIDIKDDIHKVCYHHNTFEEIDYTDFIVMG